jgi:hypothetical protein
MCRAGPLSVRQQRAAMAAPLDSDDTTRPTARLELRSGGGTRGGPVGLLLVVALPRRLLAQEAWAEPRPWLSSAAGSSWRSSGDGGGRHGGNKPHVRVSQTALALRSQKAVELQPGTRLCGCEWLSSSINRHLHSLHERLLPPLIGRSRLLSRSSSSRSSSSSSTAVAFAPLSSATPAPSGVGPRCSWRGSCWGRSRWQSRLRRTFGGGHQVVCCSPQSPCLLVHREGPKDGAKKVPLVRAGRLFHPTRCPSC